MYFFLKGVYTLLVPAIYFLVLISIMQSGGTLGFGWLPLSVGGLVLVAMGLAIWVVALITLRRVLTITPEAEALVTTGVYGWFAHPFYVGITLCYLGLSLAKGSLAGMLYTAMVIVPLHLVRAHHEERVMREKFGKNYEEYRRKVLF